MRKKIPSDTSTFHFYDANPKGKKTSDCVIRAIATITGRSWADTLRALTEYAIHYGQMVNDTTLYQKYLAELGYKKMPQPRKWDNTKYTGKEFCHEFPDMICIAHIGGHHLTAIKDGQVWDTWNSTDGCIGNYWVKINGGKVA